MIFVDQNIDIESKEFFKNIQQNDRFNIHVKHSLTNIGISEARNVGLEFSKKAKYLAFPDDDCWYSEGLLFRIKAFFEENPSVDFLCTRVFDPYTNRVLGLRPVKTKSIGFSNIFRLPISVGIFVRSNCVGDNSLFFDESIGIGSDIQSGEETKFVSKMLLMGLKGVYVGSLDVYHEVSDSNLDLIKEFEYAKGSGVLLKQIFKEGGYSIIVEFIFIILSNFYALLFRNSKSKNYTRLKGFFVGFFYRKKL
jgi:glycosyltransferase involved in cell wall biosynthesis